MRSTFLPFARPDIGPEELRRVTEVLESGWITTGEVTRRFEDEFAAAVGAKHAVALTSCTAALHLALEAAGVGRGDEVITTPYTFAATAEVVRYFDAKPVFVDVDPVTVNLDPELAAAALTERTRAIIAVGVGGLSADLGPLRRTAGQHGIVLIEDAAHCFPATYQGRPIGSIADMTCFSFYATKTITTGEGGMLTTDRDDWASRCRLMALHGIDRQPWERSTGRGSWYYEIVEPGFKYNLTDVASAIGLAQLARAEEMRDRRREIAAQYQWAFRDEPALQPPPADRDPDHAWHLYMLRLNLDRLDIDRTGFIAGMRKRNIGTSVHFIPLHIHPYYRKTYGTEPEDYPIAYREYMREISLPIYSLMTDGDTRDVIEAVLDLVRRHTVRPSV